jgi:hypothetical protein
MRGIDPNGLIIPLAVIILASLAIVANYRLEIGAGGLKFESNTGLVRAARVN